MTRTESRPSTVFRTLHRLLAVYLAISVLTLIAIVVLRDNPAMVTSAAWVRAIIVVASAALLIRFTRSAERGSRGGLRRLRVVSIVTPVAIAVIVALPGTFPLWMKIEQVVAGLLMVWVAVLANGRPVRQAAEPAAAK